VEGDGSRMIPDNVVEIAAKMTGAAPVEVKRRAWDGCRHAHTIIDETLRTVACADCGEERLDPIEVLIGLSRQWADWKRQADHLRKLNADYWENQRATWERSRDRHLGAHPDHAKRHFVTLWDGTTVPREFQIAQEANTKRKPGDYGYAISIPRDCRPCGNLVRRFEARWLPPVEP